MSSGWYWKCKKCFPTEDFLKEMTKGKDDIKNCALNLKNKDLIEESRAYYYLEIYSDRKNKRCKKCERWHIDSDNVWRRAKCKEFEPYEVPKCKICNTPKELLFVDKSSIVFIKKAFCEEKPVIWEDNVSEYGVYTPYFYYGERYEFYKKTNHFSEPEKIISCVYFEGKNGKNYGRYGAYFPSDKDFLEKLINFLKSVQDDKIKNPNNEVK